MTPGSVGVISLRSKNDRRSYFLMSLKTGRRVHARQWIVLHITESVTDSLAQFSANEGINDMVGREMLFEWKPGDPILLQPNYEEMIPPSNHTANE